MAATKTAKKSQQKDATKTPRKASKASKAEHRRAAPTVGDTAGAEFDPARTEEGERVAQTGANPSASRAGILVSFGSLDTVDGDKFAFSSLDGGSAVLSVNGKDIRLSPDNLVTLSKILDATRLGV